MNKNIWVTVCYRWRISTIVFWRWKAANHIRSRYNWVVDQGDYQLLYHHSLLYKAVILEKRYWTGRPLLNLELFTCWRSGRSLSGLRPRYRWRQISHWPVVSSTYRPWAYNMKSYIIQQISTTARCYCHSIWDLLWSFRCTFSLR